MFHVPTTVKNGGDLQRVRPGSIDDWIRVDGEEFHIFVRQILAAVPDSGGSCQKSDSFANREFNAVCHCEACLFFDVTPDFDEVESSLRCKNVSYILGLAFQFRQMSIQLIFRDSFATVELIDAAHDL